MSRRSGKSVGWAAFDRKQRQKQGLEPDIVDDPFPPLVACQKKLLTDSNNRNDKPFSSLLHPALDFPTLTDEKNGKYHKPTKALVGDPSCTSSNEDNDQVFAVPKLRELHPWADDSLLQDVLAAADNDLDKAVTLLAAMVSNHDSFERHGPTGSAEMNSTIYHIEKMDTSHPLTNTMSLADLEDALLYNDAELVRESDCLEQKKLSVEAIDQKLIVDRLKFVPLEPEWEEDDLYLIHRKDALRMMRSAWQHSRAATNAFLRDDHVSAQHHSLKARQQWSAAERLNTKAAKEILNIRNSNNDLWKLDLHGLHAAEAIQALKERLHQIETQAHPNHSVSPNRVTTENGIVRSSSFESFTCKEAEKLDIQQALSRRRPTSLQVITGVGNHSQGHAAVPVAVSSYLSENRYRFDESRPGVVTVRPKFRHR